MLTRLADALEHATDLLERECGCEYAHGPGCLAREWRALVRAARGYVDAPIAEWVDLTALAARETQRRDAMRLATAQPEREWDAKRAAEQSAAKAKP